MAQVSTPKITPFLWFDGKAEEAAQHYAAIFPDSKVLSVGRGPDGKAFSVTFELAGQRFLALNGGPQYKFTPAISLFVSCRDQAEVDRYWDAFLAAGGTPTACGWLDDQFGLSWQIIPKALTELMSDPDPKKAGAVMQAMMKMKKIDVAALYAAHASA
jgi:predicted 3-demethylubiquinone-9 3-methyltransferase (glyoxalase superfamily)